MKKRHQLRLVGITYNQIDSGVYAVILEELNGGRRIPIVIGYRMPFAESADSSAAYTRSAQDDT